MLVGIECWFQNRADLLRTIRSFLGENDMMAHLAMMAVRLSELGAS